MGNNDATFCLFSWLGQEDALRCFFQPKELASSDKCFCESCGKKTPWKQVLLKPSLFPGLGLTHGFPDKSLQTSQGHFIMADLGNLGTWGTGASHLYNFRLGISDHIIERDRKNFVETRGEGLRIVGRVFPLG